VKDWLSLQTNGSFVVMKKILVVDDEPHLRELLKEFLKSLSFEVIEASDGSAVLELIKKHDPDCILLDYMMPTVDGNIVLKRLQKSEFNIPVIMLTGNSEISVAVQCFRDGAVDYVQKPVDFDILEIVINRLFDRLESEQKLYETNLALEASMKLNDLKDQYLATLSHELRTPLNGVLNFAKMARSMLVDGNVQDAIKFLDDLLRNSDRLLQFVKGIEANAKKVFLKQ